LSRDMELDQVASKNRFRYKSDFNI